jgi:hypothetical protein
MPRRYLLSLWSALLITITEGLKSAKSDWRIRAICEYEWNVRTPASRSSFGTSITANPTFTAYNQKISIFYAANASGTTNKVTATFNKGVTSPSLVLLEYRGAATSSPFDASSTALNIGAAAPWSGSASATSAVELAVGVLYSNPSTEVPAAGTGFTTETTSSVSATYVEDQNLYVTGPVAAKWTYSQTTPSSSAVVVTFAAGGVSMGR